jgi:hypothetical protein
MNNRRQMIRVLSIACVTALTVACFAGIALAAPSLFECNWCHQQYQGDRPPPFAKCPAKDMKQNHWWIKKS